MLCGNGAGDDNEPDTKAEESGNIRITDNQWPAEAITIMDQAGIEPKYQDILNREEISPDGKNPDIR